MALNGREGAKTLYLGKAMLQGCYPQVGWCAILKARCSWALPVCRTHTRSFIAGPYIHQIKRTDMICGGFEAVAAPFSGTAALHSALPRH